MTDFADPPRTAAHDQDATQPVTDVHVRDATVCGRPGQTDCGELDKLAAELAAQGHETYVVAPHGRGPYLHVRNPGVLSENVLSDGGFYWWPWAERIAATSDVADAARAIVRVLRAVDAQR